VRDKWELIWSNDKGIRDYLYDGWEPFAVTCETNVSMGVTTFQRTVWLKRKEIPNKENPELLDKVTRKT